MNNITNYYGDLGIFLYYTPIVSAFMAAFALLCQPSANSFANVVGSCLSYIRNRHGCQFPVRPLFQREP